MSAGSGIMPTSETLTLIDDLRKNNSKYLFATFKVSGTTIIPDYSFSTDDRKEFASLKASGDEAVAKAFKTTLWPQFIELLTAADGPRFSVIDFYSINKEGRILRNLVSIGWCSDKNPAKVKMTFASTKTAFEAKINIGKKWQANDQSDLEYDTVYEAISK